MSPFEKLMYISGFVAFLYLIIGFYIHTWTKKWNRALDLIIDHKRSANPIESVNVIYQVMKSFMIFTDLIILRTK